MTEAVRRLHISQPAVTGLLRHTEDLLRFRLFERIRGWLEPTPEACALPLIVEGTIRQHVHDGLGLKIHEDGSACGSPAPSPLIDADNPQHSFTALSLRPALEVPKNGVTAHRDAKAGEQS